MATKVLWYQRPLFLQVFSVVAALVLITTTYKWSDLIHESEQEFEYFFQPKAAPGYVVISEPVKVRVTFKGSERARQALARITRREIRPVDAGLIELGENSVRIPPPDAGPRLTFVRLSPEMASVQIDAEVTRNVKIRPIVQGEASAGYQVRDVVVEPAEIAVRIPSSFAQLVEIPTLPVSIRNLDSDATFAKVQVDLPEFTAVSVPGTETVTVKVQVVPVREIRLLEPLKVELRGAPRGYTVSVQPDFISVQTQLPQDLELSARELRGIRAEVIVGSLPLNAEGMIIEGTYLREVELKDVPKIAESVQWLPRQVSLEVRAIVPESSRP